MVRAGLVASLGAATLVAAGTAAPAAVATRTCAVDAAQTTVTCRYTAVSREQTFKVPVGVTELSVVAIGGHGGDGVYVGHGGAAGKVSATLAVTAGQILYLEVGGVGQPNDYFVTGGAGGWNGGGRGGNGKYDDLSGDLRYSASGGGGASDIRTVPRALPGTLKSRLVVAGGGGGDAWVAGGDAGEAGAADYPGREGQPGTQTAGGAGGYDSFYFRGPAESGTFGRGGDGYSWQGPAYFDVGGGGGGGGAGWYGGGGAANSSGGGGGSSYTTNGTVSLADHDQAPAIVIRFSAP